MVSLDPEANQQCPVQGLVDVRRLGYRLVGRLGVVLECDEVSCPVGAAPSMKMITGCPLLTILRNTASLTSRCASTTSLGALVRRPLSVKNDLEPGRVVEHAREDRRVGSSGTKPASSRLV